MELKGLDGFIGLAEAARLTGLSMERLRQLIDAGKLPAIIDPVGRRLVRREAITALTTQVEARRRERDALLQERRSKLARQRGSAPITSPAVVTEGGSQ